jgi:hypothetical protein
VAAKVSDRLDALVWRDHERWLDDRSRLAVERERWTEEEWTAVRLAADAAWDRHRSNFYIYDAELALREHQHRRIGELLAFEASHGAEWLRRVLERTAA